MHEEKERIHKSGRIFIPCSSRNFEILKKIKLVAYVIFCSLCTLYCSINHRPILYDSLQDTHIFPSSVMCKYTCD